MSSLSNQSYNWSIQAVPAAFVLGLVPHGIYTTRLMIASSNQMSIAMPRSNLDMWKGKLPSNLWNQLSRLRGAHINSLEVFPLFAAAMLAGNAAKLPVEDLNNMAFSFLAARTVYIGLYAAISNNTLAFLRTGVYGWSIYIPIAGLWRAGRTLAES